MIRKICLLLIISAILPVCACKQKTNENIVVAMLDGEEILISDLQDDITFVLGVQNISEKETEKYQAAIYSAIEAYILDRMCQKEMESIGLTYKSEYYDSSMETLINSYGGYDKLLAKIRSLGLTEEYLNKVCQSYARQATLTEYVASQTTVNEADVLQYYIENTDSFKADEVRGMYAIFFKTEQDAEAALAEMESIGFVEYYNKPKEEKTTLDQVYFKNITKDEFPDELGEAIFSLDLNTYYKEPIKCNLGYTLIFVDHIERNYVFTYDEMKEYIKEVMQDELEDQLITEFFEELNEKHHVEIFYPDQAKTVSTG